MDKDLYYCKYWEHIYYSDYEICVSDIIYSDNRDMAQIHIIVMKKGKIVRGITGSCLNEFENVIREFIRKHFNKENDSVENGVVKIWYYNIDDSPIDAKDVPLRIAITFSNLVDNISVGEYNVFRQNIYGVPQEIVNAIFTILGDFISKGVLYETTRTFLERSSKNPRLCSKYNFIKNVRV